ncbi:MAG TPA: c-type cytochrome [Puia sp.]|jgi:mono/diheme cytochrome c family protein|nr:c-type cytochrome [Puia sp.]
MKSKLIIAASIFSISLFSLAFTTTQQPKPWVVPDKDAKAVNPVKSDAASIAAGKALWDTHCSSCHGKKGLGDGTKAAQLKTQPSDFTKPAFQTQSDGSIFYKIVEGRGDMPSFKKKIPDAEDNWSLVVFVRTLKK